MSSDFAGFDRKLTRFLKELSANNDRDWFTANRSRFASEVQQPCLAFVRAIAPKLKKISPHLAADDRKSGGSMMRIFRDVRFSKDKRPYNDFVAFRFHHEAKGDVPGFYLRIEPKGATVGTGIWQPQPPALATIRDAIATNTKAWVKVRDDAKFRKHFGDLETGDSLKRPPRGYDADHPAIEDLKRKSFVGFAKLKTSELHDEAIVDHVLDRWRSSTPLIRFLCKTLDLPF